MPNQPATPTRSVRVSDEVWQRALAKARTQGTNVSEVVRELLADWVDEAED